MNFNKILKVKQFIQKIKIQHFNDIPNEIKYFNYIPKEIILYIISYIDNILILLKVSKFFRNLIINNGTTIKIIENNYGIIDNATKIMINNFYVKDLINSLYFAYKYNLSQKKCMFNINKNDKLVIKGSVEKKGNIDYTLIIVRIKTNI